MTLETIKQKNIVVQRSTMKKLNMDQLSDFDPPITDSPLITSAIKTDDSGRENVIHILRTAEGSIFELDSENPLLQELQIAAASAAIDSFEAQTPIQTASAIKNAIQQYAGKGIVYKGSPFQAWEFAIKALEKMRDFQKIQLEVVQLNTIQAATRQLQIDQSLPIHKWILLPPHRKENAMLLTEIGLAAAMQKFITTDTVTAAENMKAINFSLSQRRKDLAEMWVNSFKETTLGIISGTGDTAVNLVGKVLSQAGNSSAEVAQLFLKITFGENLADEGAVKAVLERSGETGTKLIKLIEDSGLGINQFFKNLFQFGKNA